MAESRVERNDVGAAAMAAHAPGGGPASGSGLRPKGLEEFFPEEELAARDGENWPQAWRLAFRSNGQAVGHQVVRMRGDQRVLRIQRFAYPPPMLFIMRFWLGDSRVRSSTEDIDVSTVHYVRQEGRWGEPGPAGEVPKSTGRAIGDLGKAAKAMGTGLVGLIPLGLEYLVYAIRTLNVFVAMMILGLLVPVGAYYIHIAKPDYTSLMIIYVTLLFFLPVFIVNLVMTLVVHDSLGAIGDWMSNGLGIRQVDEVRMSRWKGESSLKDSGFFKRCSTVKSVRRLAYWSLFFTFIAIVLGVAFWLGLYEYKVPEEETTATTSNYYSSSYSFTTAGPSSDVRDHCRPGDDAGNDPLCSRWMIMNCHDRPGGMQAEEGWVVRHSVTYCTDSIFALSVLMVVVGSLAFLTLALAALVTWVNDRLEQCSPTGAMAYSVLEIYGCLPPNSQAISLLARVVLSRSDAMAVQTLVSGLISSRQASAAPQGPPSAWGPSAWEGNAPAMVHIKA